MLWVKGWAAEPTTLEPQAHLEPARASPPRTGVRPTTATDTRRRGSKKKCRAGTASGKGLRCHSKRDTACTIQDEFCQPTPQLLPPPRRNLKDELKSALIIFKLPPPASHVRDSNPLPRLCILKVSSPHLAGHNPQQRCQQQSILTRELFNQMVCH